MMNPDLRIEARFKNARLFNAIVEVCGEAAKQLHAETKGYGVIPYVRTAALVTSVSASEISALLTLRGSPFHRKTGEYTKTAKAVAEGLGKDVAELFPASLYSLDLPQSVVKEVFS